MRPRQSRGHCLSDPEKRSSPINARDSGILFDSGGQAPLVDDSPPLLGNVGSITPSVSALPRVMLSELQMPQKTQAASLSASSTQANIMFTIQDSLSSPSAILPFTSVQSKALLSSAVSEPTILGSLVVEPSSTILLSFTLPQPLPSPLLSPSQTPVSQKPAASSSNPSSASTAAVLPSSISRAFTTNTSASPVVAPISTSNTATTTSSTTSALPSAASATASAVQSSSNGHGTEFYVGIAFATIVALAFLVSFAAWLLRSRSRNSGWFWRRSGLDDVEHQDLGFGLGGYGSFLYGANQDEESTPSATAASEANSRDVNCSARIAERSAISLTLAPQNPFVVPLPTSFSVAPYPNPRPLPVHLRSADTEARVSRDLGPLQVANLMPGDTQSMSDASMRPTSRYSYNDDAVLAVPDTSRLGFNGTEYGTPRELEAGLVPRFQSLGGMGLEVPWAPVTKRPPSVKISHSRSSSLSLRPNRQWEHLPPLPLPGTVVSQPGDSGLDRWGATLRASLASALSAVSGRISRTPSEKSQQAADNLTAMPERQQRSYVSLSRHTTLASTLDWRLEDTREDGGIVQFSALGFGTDSLMAGASLNSFGTFDVQDNPTGRNLSYASTTPLIISKKVNQRTCPPPKKTYELSDPLSEGGSGSGALTRASSVYSSYSVEPNTSVSRAQTSRSRPGLFKRTSSSVCSFSSRLSSCSEVTVGEQAAKRLLAMRDRRKMGMSVRRPAMDAMRAGTQYFGSGSKKGFKALDKEA